MTEVSKNHVARLIVSAEDEGQRLDNYLLRLCKGVPKSHVYRIIRSGEVRLNACRAAASYRLKAGDALRVPPVRVAQAQEEIDKGAKIQLALPPVYEDEAMLAVDKPAGIAVHGGSGVSFGVIEALRRQRPQARFLELAHRLDRETSGLLLVGKKRSALKILHDMFREGGIDKRYLLLVQGRWMEAARKVDLPLCKYLLPSGERRVRVASGGKPSQTLFRLWARWENFSLLEARLLTGRTHQIRAHCASLGFPIAGDEKYGDFAVNRLLQKAGLKRMFLHSWKIQFPHPMSRETLALEAPLPDVLQAFLKKLSIEESLSCGRTP